MNHAITEYVNMSKETEMKKIRVLQKITETGVVAVIRAGDPVEAVKISKACVKGGIKAIEITFTVPGAADILKELSNTFNDTDILIGAGTVLDPETARTAILSGADFIVSPALNDESAKLCARYGIPYMPGAMTVKEVIECMESGADIVKIFPGELFGPKIIKAILGPLPYASLMPTGGVSVKNAGEWISSGAVAVGAGGSLTAGAKTGDFDLVTRTASELVAEVKKARG